MASGPKDLNTGARKGATVARAVSKSAKSGSAWVVTSGGDRKTVVASDASSRRIKEAARRYEGALRRLADR